MNEDHHMLSTSSEEIVFAKIDQQIKNRKSYPISKEFILRIIRSCVIVPETSAKCCECTFSCSEKDQQDNREAPNDLGNDLSESVICWKWHFNFISDDLRLQFVFSLLFFLFFFFFSDWIDMRGCFILRFWLLRFTLKFKHTSS